MKHIYWLAAALVVILGIYFSTQFSLAPQSTARISFAQYEVPEEFGQKILENLQDKLEKAPVIFLGVSPNQIEDIELWRGFLEANQQAGKKYEVVVVESNLPYVEIFHESLHIPLKEDLNRLVAGIGRARSEGLRVAVIAPSIYVSQLIKNNLVDRLKSDFNIEILSLSAVKFPLTREQESTFEPKCIDGGAVDPAGTSSLGCMIRNIARRTYLKKFQAGKYIGLMDQTGPKDYLILFNQQ